MRKWIMTGLGLVFFLTALLLGSQAVSAAPMPDFPTLPLKQNLVRVVENGSLVSSQDGKTQYIQVTPAATGKKGAVWFNQPLSFDKDFDIEMYIYIDSRGTGDGMGVLLKDASETSKWIGDYGSGSLGFLGAEDFNVLQSPLMGSIPKTFAVEFDNYWNQNRMDANINNSDHVAYSWPNVRNSYNPSGWLALTNHLNHHEVQYTKLATGQWRKFTMNFKHAANTLTYQLDGLPSKTITGFVGGNANDKETFASGKAYLGFAGSTGQNAGAVQEMAVTFTKVPNVLNMTMNQKIYDGDQQTPFFDSAVLKDQAGVIPQQALTASDTLLRYETTVAIDDSSSMNDIGLPSFKVKVPDQVTLLHDATHPFTIDGQPVTATLDSSGKYYQVTGATPLQKGKSYILQYFGKPVIPANGTLAVTNEADVSLRGAIFGEASLPKDSNQATLKYQLLAKAQPVLTQTIQQGEKVVYQTGASSPEKITLGSTKDRLEVTMQANLSEDSTLENAGNGTFTIPTTPGLSIVSGSVKVNGVAVSPAPVPDQNGQLVVATGQPVTKTTPVSLTYEVAPEWVVNENKTYDLNLQGTVAATYGTSVIVDRSVAVLLQGVPTIALQAKSQTGDSGQLIPAVAFADLAQGSWQVISQKKALTLTGLDQDENSQAISYYFQDLKDTLPSQEPAVDPNQDTKFTTHSGRQALNDGSPQKITQLTIPQEQIAAMGTGKHYLALYGVDQEGNLSNRQYLLLNIFSDKLTLDKVPDLSFDDSQLFNANDIAALAEARDTRDYGLKQSAAGFQVPHKLLGFDGALDPSGEIMVTDARTDRTKGWQLTLSIPDITEAVSNGRSLSPDAGIVLQLGIKGQAAPLNILYQKYGGADVNELTLKQQGNGGGTVVAKKQVVVATGKSSSDVSEIISTKLLVDPATTYLRIKKGSQNNFTHQATFQLQLSWTLTTVDTDGPAN